MTSEIAILNRNAVALAADSAITLTRWVESERREKYLKSANKLFHISRVHPIGLMIHQAANICGVPWEVVIKAYRDSLGFRSFPTVKAYPPHLFAYIQGHQQLFPMDTRREALINSGLSSTWRMLRESWRDLAQPAEVVREQARKKFSALVDAVTKGTYIGDCTDADLGTFVEGYKGAVLGRAQADDALKAYSAHLDLEAAVELGLRALLKKEWTIWEKTGLVFAGFGETEFFPQLVRFDVFAILENKLICAPAGQVSITSQNTSEIVPIASSQMINTFVYGMSEDVADKVIKSLRSGLNAFEAEFAPVEEAAKAQRDEAKAKLLQTAFDEIGGYMREAHIWPLLRTVGDLAIDELAQLAETLISLESLKERVTTTSETVGGPIDVAVISRSDGFIWIKRKHYFDPALNPRYFNRERQAVEEEGA